MPRGFCYFAHVSLSVSGLVFVLHSLHASPSTRRRGSSIAGKSIHVQTTSASQASIPTWLPFLGMSLCAAAFIIIVNAITNGICEGGTSSPSCPPAVPPQHTFFVILVGILLTFGLGGLLGATNQSMALPSSMLVQMAWGGLLLPGNIIANVIVAAINNAVVAQSLSLLSDYRVGILLKISPRVMFVTQLLGTGVGVLSSTLSCVRPPLPALTNCDIWVRYQMVIGFSRSGTIVLNQGLWPNVGAGATNSTVSLVVVSPIFCWSLQAATCTATTFRTTQHLSFHPARAQPLPPPLAPPSARNYVRQIRLARSIQSLPRPWYHLVRVCATASLIVLL